MTATRPGASAPWRGSSAARIERRAVARIERRAVATKGTGGHLR
jgi:hypothetical protein